MPDITPHHPKRSLPDDSGFTPNPRSAYVELGLTSCFSFLRGASEACDLVQTAWEAGYDALGVADHNTLAGVVRFYVEAEKAHIRPLIGCRIVLTEGDMILAYPTDRASYGRLSTLLSKGKRHTPDGTWQDKGACDIPLADLRAAAEGLRLIVIPPYDLTKWEPRLKHLKRSVPQITHIAAAYLYRGADRARINHLDALADRNGLSILATNDVLYHAPDRRPLQDVMTCIREKRRLSDAGYLLEPNAERHLKTPAEMCRLFAEWPHAIRATREVADSIRFDLRELSYEYQPSCTA